MGTYLQTAHGFLQSRAESATDGHHFSHRLHLRAQSRISPWELLEMPAGDLDHHVVQGRLEGRRSLTSDVVGYLVQPVTHCQQGGDLGDGEAGGFGCEGRGAGDAGIHLDDHHPAIVGMYRELHVGTAGLHAYHRHHDTGHVAQALELPVGEGHGGSDGDAVAGVNPHGVQILNRTDDDEVVCAIAHDFQFVFLPAQHRLFHQDLPGGTLADAPGRCFQQPLLVQGNP